MYVDASAIVAILGRESDAEALLAKLDGATPPFFVSPMGLFEAVLGLAARKARDAQTRPDARLIEQAEAAVDQFVAELGAEEVAISAEIRREALATAKRYGRLTGHPADLNFGDCFAYACANACRVPLLYKGGDFANTDMA